MLHASCCTFVLLLLVGSQGKKLLWESLAIVGRQGKKLAPPLPPLRDYEAQEHACPPLCTLYITLSKHHDMAMQLIAMRYAGASSSAWPGSQADRSKQGPLSRAWGLRRQRIGEAQQPGLATEAVVTRKGLVKNLKSSLPRFVNPVSLGNGPLTSPRVATELTDPPQARLYKLGSTPMEGGFTEESLEALQALQEAWLAEQPGPSFKTSRARAKRRPRSAPPSQLHPMSGEEAVLAANLESAPAQPLSWNELKDTSPRRAWP